MKKVLMVCFAIAMSVVTFNNAKAQSIKIGSFEEEALLGLMPEIDKVSVALNKYVSDSLNPKRDYQMSELKRKDSTFKADSGKMGPSLKEIMQKEIAQHYYTVSNWQEISNEALQGKREELLAPFRQKIYGVLNEIITAEKYTHVLKAETVLTIPICDNLAIKTAIKLGLKLPKETEDAFKTACGASAAAPTKPAPKPAPKGKG